MDISKAYVINRLVLIDLWIDSFPRQSFVLIDFFFSNPVSVAKANMASKAIPNITLAPCVTPAPTATKIESLINTLIISAGAKFSNGFG